MTSVRQHGPPQHVVITPSEKAFCKLSCYVVRVWYNVCSISNKLTREHVMTQHELAHHMHHQAQQFWAGTIGFLLLAYALAVIVWFVRNR